MLATAVLFLNFRPRKGTLSQNRGGKGNVRLDFFALFREQPITRQGLNKLSIVLFPNTGTHARVCRKTRVETTIDDLVAGPPDSQRNLSQQRCPKALPDKERVARQGLKTSPTAFFLGCGFTQDLIAKERLSQLFAAWFVEHRALPRSLLQRKACSNRLRRYPSAPASQRNRSQSEG